jgi:hypothetical protein
MLHWWEHQWSSSICHIIPVSKFMCTVLEVMLHLHTLRIVWQLPTKILALLQLPLPCDDNQGTAVAPVSCPFFMMLQAICYPVCLPKNHDSPWICDVTHTSWIGHIFFHSALSETFISQAEFDISPLLEKISFSTLKTSVLFGSYDGC